MLSRLRILALVPIALLSAKAASAQVCPPENGVALQILGSGGPIADDARSSAGYLVWVDGSSRIMIDAGGGTFLRFGEAAAKFVDLDFIGLSHFHTDHCADLPALLKSGFFSHRRRSLIVAGPGSGGPFPGLNEFLNAMLGDDGAFAYLSGYLDGTGKLPDLEPVEIYQDNVEAVKLIGNSADEMQIEALHVPHGIVPAIAFRVRVGRITVVFASDQNGNDPRFIEFARNANVLVMHMPVPEGIAGEGRKLHAPPNVIGKVANAAQVDMLVLSHLMRRSLEDLDKNVAAVKTNYDGTVVIASDLDCMVLEKQGTNIGNNGQL